MTFKAMVSTTVLPHPFVQITLESFFSQNNFSHEVLVSFSERYLVGIVVGPSHVLEAWITLSPLSPRHNMMEADILSVTICQNLSISVVRCQMSDGRSDVRTCNNGIPCPACNSDHNTADCKGWWRRPFLFLLRLSVVDSLSPITVDGVLIINVFSI